MRTEDFDYPLPAELIAQQPAPNRDQSRLLVLHRSDGRIEHRRFHEISMFLRSGDVLVLNDSKVIPARLRAVKPGTGGRLEILLLEETATNEWWVLLRPGKRVRIGAPLRLVGRGGRPTAIEATVLAKHPEGRYQLRFRGAADLSDELGQIGEMPVPPYIERGSEWSQELDWQRYQTVYARQAGSVAAPTAGLHFTPELLEQLRRRGVELQYVTLHVGLGTFAPIKANDLAGHVMHEERFRLEAAAAAAINAARAEHRRVFAVGTTTVRVLESVARRQGGTLAEAAGRTNLFLHPPATFQIVDGLLTNFHLPRSTLLMLVSAFAAPGETRGRELMLGTYGRAIAERYRFFSYGDAMLIL